MTTIQAPCPDCGHETEIRDTSTHGTWSFAWVCPGCEKRRELGTWGGPRIVIGPVEMDEDDVIKPWE